MIVKNTVIQIITRISPETYLKEKTIFENKRAGHGDFNPDNA